MEDILFEEDNYLVVDKYFEEDILFEEDNYFVEENLFEEDNILEEEQNLDIPYMVVD